MTGKQTSSCCRAQQESAFVPDWNVCCIFLISVHSLHRLVVPAVLLLLLYSSLRVFVVGDERKIQVVSLEFQAPTVFPGLLVNACSAEAPVVCETLGDKHFEVSSYKEGNQIVGAIIGKKNNLPRFAKEM